MAIILFFFLSCLYFSKILKNKINYIILFIISFIITIILLLQSRTTIIFLPISLIFIYLFLQFDGYRDRIKFPIFAIILPVFIFLVYPISKNYFIEKYEIKTEPFFEDEDRVNFLRNDLVLKEIEANKLEKFSISDFK